MLKKYYYLINGLRMILDVVIIIASFVIAYFLRFHTTLLGAGQISLTLAQYAAILLFVVPVHIIGYKVVGLYDRLRTKKFALQMRNIMLVTLVSIGFVFVYLFLAKLDNYSRLLLGVFYVGVYCATVLAHFIEKKILNNLRIRESNLRHVAIVGAGRMGKEYAQRLATHPEFGFEISAFFDDEPEKKDVGAYGADVFTLDDMEKYLKDNLIDLIVIALPNSAVDVINQVINVSELYGVKSQIIPDYYKLLPAKPKMDDIDGLPLLHTRYVPLDSWGNKMTKRLFDFVAAFFGLLLISPVLLVVAILVKVTSPGPVIYKQKRVGYNRRVFNMYKFRSMKYVPEDKPGWTTENDDRKTKFGEFMRKHNIDELLQLYNVLKGDMSLVGPRPEQPAFVEQFMYEIPKYMIKHHVKPGMTGWAQVNGWRGDTSIEERIKCDIYYIENWTLGLDIKIIIKTFFHGKENAY
ncbi:MAG: undecaprenyl-phosphate glucose phosphotransferase [Eubacteriales bacterium]